MARKKRSLVKTLGYGLVLVLVILGIVTFAGYQFSLGGGCGSNILSTSIVSYKSNDAVLNFEDSILINLVPSIENECAYGYVSKERINQDLDIETQGQVRHDFEIHVENLKQKCDYQVKTRIPVTDPRSDYRAIYRVTSSRESCESATGGCANALDKCEQIANFYTYSVACYDIFHLNCDLTCYFSDPIAWYEEILTPAKFSGDTRITMRNSPGEVLSSGVVGTDVPFVNLDAADGSLKARAEFNGFLLGGIDCPTPAANKIALYQIEPAELRGHLVISKTKYDDWSGYDKSGFDADLNNCEAAGVNYLTCLATAENKYNNLAFETLTEEQIQWAWIQDRGGTYTQDTSGDESEGIITLTTDKLLRFASITLHVDADWVGIFSPMGIPEIVSVSPELVLFESTGSGRTTAKIKNIGDTAGSFTTKIECSTGFFGSADTRIFAAGETQQVPLTVTGTCAATETGTCTVSVTGKTQSDTWGNDIGVTCNPLPVCTEEGFKKCSLDQTKVLICRNGEWETDEKCELGCVLVEGVPSCRTAECTKPEDCNDNNPCTFDDCRTDIFGNVYCANIDLPNCGYCGDGVCNPQQGEDRFSCEADCSLCGDGICSEDLGETVATCPVDCDYVCGDGTCDPDETEINCPEDCGFVIDIAFWVLLATILGIVLLGASVAIKVRKPAPKKFGVIPRG